jgi:hypothetical protein
MLAAGQMPQAETQAPEQPKAPEKPAQPPAETGPALSDLTVKALRELAAEKGITLGRDLTAKADIVAALEKALGESPAHSS